MTAFISSAEPAVASDSIFFFRSKGCFVSSEVNSSYQTYSSGCMDFEECLSRKEGEIADCSLIEIQEGITLAWLMPFSCLSCCTGVHNCNQITEGFFDYQLTTSEDLSHQRTPNASSPAPDVAGTI